MKTEVNIDGNAFLINGRPTYEGVTFDGKKVEGLLFNSRMIQGIFDDANPETRAFIKYPDTGIWDPDRNTDEFCAALPEYRSYGLLGFTVGLQGGGHYYNPEIYDHYVNSAFHPDGTFKEAYFERLYRVLKAADEAGMVVIVNYFYWKQVEKIHEDSTIFAITEAVTSWLLETGFKNILVDVANEAAYWWTRSVCNPDNIHKMIDIAQNIELKGRRLLVSSSSGGGEEISIGKWREMEDFSMPHGNGCTPAQLHEKLRKFKDSDELKAKNRPILINEDSVFVENLDAAFEEYASWGFYCQGYGSKYKDRMDWTKNKRETVFSKLSGFQTVPVNWGINTDIKQAFFDRIKVITTGN